MWLHCMVTILSYCIDDNPPFDTDKRAVVQVGCQGIMISQGVVKLSMQWRRSPVSTERGKNRVWDPIIDKYHNINCTTPGYQNCCLCNEKVTMCQGCYDDYFALTTNFIILVDNVIFSVGLIYLILQQDQFHMVLTLQHFS